MRFLAVRPLVLSSLVFLLSCGFHEQNLKRTAPNVESKVLGECEPTECLILGVSDGDLERVKKAISDGADINVRDNDGVPLLMSAIIAEQLGMIDFLIQSGVDTSLKSTSENTASGMDVFAFMQSEFFKAEPLIKSIVEKIVAQEEFSVDDLAAVMEDAIKFRYVSLADWLLSEGLDPNWDDGRNTFVMKLFSLKALANEPTEEDDTFLKVKELFFLFANHPEIDLSKKVKGSARRTALVRAQKAASKKPHYQELVEEIKNRL